MTIVETKHTKMPDIVHPGEKIMASNQFNIIILNRKASGSFGQVNTADLNWNDGRQEQVAVKVESINAKRRVLLTEASILNKLKGNEFFPKVYAKGNHDNKCSFMVLEYSQGSLRDYALQYDSKKYINDVVCLINITTQVIEAFRYMHNIGIVHRDIKPGNMLVKDFNKRTKPYVQLIDFGLSRRYADADGTLRKPRETGEVPFRGTKLYCSIGNLMKIEHGRCHDLLGFFYSLANISYPKKLPWKGSEPTEKLIDARKSFTISQITNKDNHAFDSALQFLHDHCSALTFADTPDYDKIISKFQKSAPLRKKSSLLIIQPTEPIKQKKIQDCSNIPNLAVQTIPQQKQRQIPTNVAFNMRTPKDFHMSLPANNDDLQTGNKAANADANIKNYQNIDPAHIKGRNPNSESMTSKSLNWFAQSLVCTNKNR